MPWREKDAVEADKRPFPTHGEKNGEIKWGKIW